MFGHGFIKRVVSMFHRGTRSSLKTEPLAKAVIEPLEERRLLSVSLYEPGELTYAGQ